MITKTVERSLKYARKRAKASSSTPRRPDADPWIPGPWVAREEEEQYWKISSVDYGQIATMHDPYAREQSRIEELAATARLIAAAPELYVALEACKTAAGYGYDSTEDNANNPIMQAIGDAIERARKALSAADGRTR
jgi:hypothetical protein